MRAARDAAASLHRVATTSRAAADHHLPASKLRIYVLGPPRDPKLARPDRAGERDVRPRPSAAAGPTAAGAGWRLGVDGSGTTMTRRSTPTSAPALAAIGARRDGPRADSRPDPAAFARARYFGPSEGGGADPSRRRVSRPLPKRRPVLAADRQDWLGDQPRPRDAARPQDQQYELALAFEFNDTGRVLLFAADAQVGSWLSLAGAQWKSTAGGNRPRPPGPHGLLQGRASRQPQRNAEGKGARADDEQGSLRVHPDQCQGCREGRLEVDALHRNPRRARGRCSGRVIRADDPWIAGNAPGPQFQAPSGSIKKLSHDKEGLWVELELA